MGKNWGFLDKRQMKAQKGAQLRFWKESRILE
jgi:hypothetical protein